MTDDMRALRLRLRPFRAAWAATAGRFRDEAWAGGHGSPLQLVAVPRPRLPDAGWARVRVDLGGVCASDLKILRVTDLSPVLSAWNDPRTPAILGHEVVGTVTEALPASGLAPGDRVVAEPVLSCRDKGLAPCARCRAGDDHLCENLAEPGHLAVGNGFGFNARYGGGWAEELVAPGWRCVRVPDALADVDAVLAEPMAIAVHAVARTTPGPGSGTGTRSLVVGPGTIGLSTLVALRSLAPESEVTVAGLGGFADALCADLGAAQVIHGTRAELLEQAAAVTGGALRKPLLGHPVLDGGFDVVYDCVGSAQTIDDAMRMLRPGGKLVLVATSGRQKVDWSLVWWRELQVFGSVFYAQEPDGRRALARAVEILDEVRPGEQLVTHRFALEDATAALTTAAGGPAAEAVKVAFSPHA